MVDSNEDMANIQLSQPNEDRRDKILKDFFNLMVSNNHDTLEMEKFTTGLQYYKIDSKFPEVYKLLTHDYKKKKMNLEHFRKLVKSSHFSKEPPTVEEFTYLFEMLDKDKSGIISPKDLTNMFKSITVIRNIFLENSSSHHADFESEKKKVKVNNEHVSNIISIFDLENKNGLSPEEFFNIVMAFYEKKF